MGRRGQHAGALLADLGRAYAKAVLAGDEVGAELAVRDAIDGG